jgi:glyoxylase-like metal-dependent hydrolase (beta-lactamase superfamily II)
MGELKIEELLPDLWRIDDTCAVYVVKDGDRAVAIDFGSGEWLPRLRSLGIEHLDHVLITHPHAEQCAGLLAKSEWPFALHVPAGPSDWPQPPWIAGGCPPNYEPPKGPLPGAVPDLAGNCHFFWQGRRIRFVDTPGHTAHAVSVVIDHAGKQIVFCGDAAHAGGTMHEPFNLEWDHWTGGGALAAWEGIRRLRGVSIDLLCPSHGPVIAERPAPMLEQLARKLLAFYEAKGQISPGEPDRYVPVEIMACGARKVSEHRLYQYGGNGYLLVSDSGEGLVVDPHLPEMPALEALLAELGGVRPSACVVSHYHYDHCDGIGYLREKYGAKAWLHPLIAAPWEDPAGSFMPWLLTEPIVADELWPERGAWRWNEYDFQIAPWHGQTWGHCVFMTSVNGRRVMFAGDSFTPSSKWNGTGGFCAYNNSRFGEGFAPAARLALEWKPEILAAGHNNTYYFAASKFRKIIKWAERAEAAVRALCPSGDLERDYYSVREIIAKQVEP